MLTESFWRWHYCRKILSCEIVGRIYEKSGNWNIITKVCILKQHKGLAKDCNDVRYNCVVAVLASFLLDPESL